MYWSYLYRHVAFTTLLVVTLACANASATNLPPGGAISLSGAPSNPGTVIRDALIPFAIEDDNGNVLFEGVVQDRVVELDSTGNLEFSKWIRDTNSSVNGAVTSFNVDGYTGVTSDVEWSNGTGTRAPDTATRSGDGDDIAYFFTDEPIFGGQESEFPFVVTDVEEFTVTGRMTITVASGFSTTIEVAAPAVDTTAPDAQLNEPGPDACVCGSVEVRGIADDPDGTYESDMLEYRALDDTSWTLVGTASSPVPAPGGLLYIWDTTGLDEGRYLLRLTVNNTAGLSSTAVTTVWVNAQFDVFEYNRPDEGEIVGGNVCPGGTINNFNGDCAENFEIEFAPAGSGSFMPIDPGMPVYTGSRINQTFAVWDSSAVADGEYDLRVRAFDDCGNEVAETHTVTVDNTDPVAEIDMPMNCAQFEPGDTVTVTGTASDANLSAWSLQYSGGSSHSWNTIATGNTDVIDDVLAVWDTSDLEPCCYVLRLVVNDQANVNCGSTNNRTVYLTTVQIGDCPADLDGDGIVNVFDLLDLLAAWGACN